MDWKSGPPVLVGEKVLWSGNTYSKPVTGVIKWIGNIPEISSDWCLGLETELALPGIGGDGFWKGRELFRCRSKHGLLVPIEEIHKLRPKSQSATTSIETHPHFKLDGSQLRDFTLSSLRCKPQKEIKKTQIKNRYSKPESKIIEESFNNSTSDSGFDSQKEKRKTAAEVLGEGNNTDRQPLKLDDQDFKNLPRKDTGGINLEESKNPKSESSNKPNVKNIFENPQTFDSRTSVHEFLKNMNEIAGYFKEIKEGDERFEKQEQTDNNALCESNESGHSKPKKLFSFLKWFNKKHKHEPNLKLFQETSPPSSPVFSRRETSSCDSLDTLFSTQTVRSFAYIPPTQYKPSAPPLDFEEFPEQKSEEAESTYDRRKKRKAPEPPRLTRENSLPSTLERKTTEDDDYGKSFHRRTVSESFKDKKAGSYCHVQGKRKAPPPPSPQLYPNLQKVNSQCPSLHKKKKPAPLPPEPFYENTTKEKETEEPKREKPKGEKEEKETKINQMFKDGLTKDVSLSPLPSRPWYKRSHRDSTGSNIIKKDLLKGFEKKKNKETDDWMPEVGFPRRSLSSETHSKFNIFSKLEKTEDKKKEEKRKSQISILTNISELDREAAEIVRKEQAEEKKMMAENDERYYSPKGLREKIHEQDETFMNPTENLKFSNKIPNNQKSNRGEGKSNSQTADKIIEPRAISDRIDPKDTKTGRGESTIDEHLKTKEETLKDKENNLTPDSESNGNPKQNLFSPNVLADLTNSSSQSPPGKIPKAAQNPSQARLNFFNVQNKELSYLNEPWVCQKCTLENPGWRVFCEICSSVKPRFTFNKTATEAKVTTDKREPATETKITTEVKREPAIDKPTPAAAAEPGKTPKPAAGESEETTEPISPTAENEVKPVETLDELRKKRMNFFSPKSETEKTEPGPSAADPDKSKPKKNFKEIKDFFPEKTPVEENTEKRVKEIEENEKKEAEEIRETKEKEEESDEKQVRTKQQEESDEKEAKRKPEPETKENPIITAVGEDQQQPITTSKPTAGSNDNTEQIAEAYMITKTIILEDIIVKKPDRGRKVSASVQTKSTLTGGPQEPKVVRPPPRTKKLVLSETDKGAEPELYSEVQKRLKNYKQEDLEELTSRLTRAEGLADFRAKIETMPLNTEMNTVAVNRLLRKLEAAINSGDQFVAAGLAKELALMKINCCVTRQITPSPGPSKITVDLYIEDKVSHQGPIPLEVSPTMSLLQLKKKIHKDFGIPLEVQRWILGKKLATDDNKTLESEGVNTDYCPLFLYLVAPENPKTDKEASKTPEKNSETNQNRQPATPVPGPKGKGWYYNYEEDHYSYCEDSDDDSDSSSPNNKIQETTCRQTITEISPSNLNKTEEEPTKGVNKGDKFPVFDLKSRDGENEVEKELKFISANSVKQKVEQLNKTFAESSRPLKPPLRSSRSPESWKCAACNVVNLPGRLSCSSCNAKKVVTGPNNRKIFNGAEQPAAKKENAPKTDDENVHYKALVELQDADLVPNIEPFTCTVCLVDYGPGEGVTLKDCLHTFCRTCLISTVQYSDDAEVKCPYLDDRYSCPSVLQQREIKALVPRGIFELHLAKSVKEAENKIENAFHCKTPDCKGWCIYEDNVNQFRCPVCKSMNCLTCQAIHNGINCKEYQERMKDASETDVDAKKTREMLNEMVEKGEAMVCPKCQVVLMKKWGCDWLKCSMCKTEICWVTRGFRWGPEGKGDTSGGCKCGLNGVKCHPKCNYCH